MAHQIAAVKKLESFSQAKGKNMTEQLAVLLDSRSVSETTLLHDLLKEHRGDMISRGTFHSSMYILGVLRICADYVEKYSAGALEDYKRAISSDLDKYDETYLSNTATTLLNRISQEKDKVQGILISNAGDVAAAMSNKGLLDYKSLDSAFQSVWNRSKAEIEIFNAKLIESRPTFYTLLKEKWERQPVVVAFTVVVTVIVFLGGFLEKIQKMIFF